MVRCPTEGEDEDGGYGDDDASEHDDDEPCGSFGSLRRRLSDAHGVDEGVREEEDEFHVEPTHR